ncbi:MAG: InlB B-repeat-containing protein [Eubacteriaceae bacterium]
MKIRFKKVILLIFCVGLLLAPNSLAFSEDEGSKEKEINLNFEDQSQSMNSREGLNPLSAHYFKDMMEVMGSILAKGDVVRDEAQKHVLYYDNTKSVYHIQYESKLDISDVWWNYEAISEIGGAVGQNIISVSPEGLIYGFELGIDLDDRLVVDEALLVPSVLNNVFQQINDPELTQIFYIDQAEYDSALNEIIVHFAINESVNHEQLELIRNTTGFSQFMYFRAPDGMITLPQSAFTEIAPNNTIVTESRLFGPMEYQFEQFVRMVARYEAIATGVMTENTITMLRNTSYTVQFNSNGGSLVGDITDVQPGATIIEPQKPFRDGFIFEGWYKEESLINQWDFANDSVKENIMLYAKWKPEPNKNTQTESNKGKTEEVKSRKNPKTGVRFKYFIFN